MVNTGSCLAVRLCPNPTDSSIGGNQKSHWAIPPGHILGARGRVRRQIHRPQLCHPPGKDPNRAGPADPLGNHRRRHAQPLWWPPWADSGGGRRQVTGSLAHYDPTIRTATRADWQQPLMRWSRTPPERRVTARTDVSHVSTSSLGHASPSGSWTPIARRACDVSRAFALTWPSDRATPTTTVPVQPATKYMMPQCDYWIGASKMMNRRTLVSDRSRAERCRPDAISDIAAGS